jgi:hypothetical protein
MLYSKAIGDSTLSSETRTIGDKIFVKVTDIHDGDKPSRGIKGASYFASNAARAFGAASMDASVTQHQPVVVNNKQVESYTFVFQGVQ